MELFRTGGSNNIFFFQCYHKMYSKLIMINNIVMLKKQVLKNNLIFDPNIHIGITVS